MDEMEFIDTAVRDMAAIAMLKVLKEFTAWRDCPPSLRGTGWDAYGDTLDGMARVAIDAAEAAGIDARSP